MTRTQRIALCWYMRRSLRFKVVMFLPAAPDVKLDVQPGRIIRAHRPEPPIYVRRARTADLKRLTFDCSKWGHPGPYYQHDGMIECAKCQRTRRRREDDADARVRAEIRALTKAPSTADLLPRRLRR